MEIPPAVPAHRRSRPHFYSSTPQLFAKGPAGKNAGLIKQIRKMGKKYLTGSGFIGL
jgi:hypothetical protein